MYVPAICNEFPRSQTDDRTRRGENDFLVSFSQRKRKRKVGSIKSKIIRALPSDDAQ